MVGSVKRGSDSSK